MTIPEPWALRHYAPTVALLAVSAILGVRRR